MQIPENRAININSLNGNPFPVNIELAKMNGVYCVYLTPISILEMLDLIPLQTFLVFNVDANEYDGMKSVTLKQLAIKYSSYLEAFDEETLLFDKKSLVQLLTKISHYNFCLVDAGTETKIDKVIQIIDLADKWNEKTVINEVSANVFLSSHDDCYLYLETSDENLALELIGLQIKVLVATVTNCPINKLKFDPKDIITKDKFSIIITQNPVKTSERATWKILEGTFKDFVYSKEMTESEFELVFDEPNNAIKIEKVRSRKTSDNPNLKPEIQN
jgi:hypothetical protein